MSNTWWRINNEWSFKTSLKIWAYFKGNNRKEESVKYLLSWLLPWMSSCHFIHHCFYNIYFNLNDIKSLVSWTSMPQSEALQHGAVLDPQQQYSCGVSSLLSAVRFHLHKDSKQIPINVNTAWSRGWRPSMFGPLPHTHTHNQNNMHFLCYDSVVANVCFSKWKIACCVLGPAGALQLRPQHTKHYKRLVIWDPLTKGAFSSIHGWSAQVKYLKTM